MVTTLPSVFSIALVLAGVLRTLVMPLDDLSSEPAYAWIGEAFSEALSSHLQSAGHDVVGLAELHHRLDEMGLAPGVPVTRATVIVLGRELGATRAVVGSYSVERGEAETLIEAHIKVLDLERGATVGVIEDHGPLEALLELENRFAMNLLRLEGDALPASFAEHAARRLRLDLEAHEKLARARMAADVEQRRRYVEEALANHNHYVEAQLLLGQVLLDSGQPVDAIRVLSAIEPGEYVYREAYFLLGLAYLEANQTAAAIEIFSHLSEQEDKAVCWNNLAIAFLRTGNMEKAIEAFGRAVESASGDSIYSFNLGWANWRAGKGAEALRWFREAVRQSPEDAEAHLLLSAAARAQALPEEADNERERAVALAPELADVDASTVVGLERVAHDFPRRSVGRELSREPVTELLERARAHRASGRLAEASGELQRALYLEPHWTEARLELAEVYRESGQLERAVGEYRIVLWDEETASVHLRLAELYAEMGDGEPAARHVERALELEPENPEAQRLLEKLKEPEAQP